MEDIKCYDKECTESWIDIADILVLVCKSWGRKELIKEILSLLYLKFEKELLGIRGESYFRSKKKAHMKLEVNKNW